MCAAGGVDCAIEGLGDFEGWSSKRAPPRECRGRNGPFSRFAEEAVIIEDWEGDRGAMEETRQILKGLVEY